ncbi:MAG: DUF167 domain-containing protein [Thermoplasmata archaeon]|nr:DUF167 domain-containing protein [Thermoplasmata archaeon]
MVRSDIIEQTDGGCYINLEISPNANQSGIISIDKWRRALKIDIAAEASRGEANKELIRFLEKMLPEAKGKIAIVKGLKSSQKRVFLPLRPKEAIEKLGLENDL